MGSRVGERALPAAARRQIDRRHTDGVDGAGRGGSGGPRGGGARRLSAEKPTDPGVGSFIFSDHGSPGTPDRLSSCMAGRPLLPRFQHYFARGGSSAGNSAATRLPGSRRSSLLRCGLLAHGLNGGAGGSFSRLTTVARVS
eukprot:681352-Prymnesium_polylepis.1